MAARPPKKPLPTSLFARFGVDRRGVSALEFALIAPILILTYFGVGELCEAMMAQRRTAHAASAIGDLTAQASSVATSDVSDIFAAATDILTPFPTTPLKMRLTSVTGNASAVPKVDWSCTQGGMTKNTPGTTYTGLPDRADRSRRVTVLSWRRANTPGPRPPNTSCRTG